MNAYEYVEKLLKSKRHNISLNELQKYSDWRVALAILKQHHEAECTPSDCSYCCDSWEFNNPFLTKSDHYVSYYVFGESKKLERCIISKDIARIVKEIIRLDQDKTLSYEENKEVIEKNLFRNGVYANKRVWILRIEMHYD